MEHKIAWDHEKKISKDLFCKLTNTPENWRIFETEKNHEFYECILYGKIFWRCDTDETLWVFTRMDNKIVFKFKDRYRYRDNDYWSEWHDWEIEKVQR